MSPKLVTDVVSDEVAGPKIDLMGTIRYKEGACR